MNIKSFLSSPNPLAQYYKRFRVDERILLTGHSHQAWPDCSLDGQIQAWKEAAMFVDNKWLKAFDKADEVRKGFSSRLDDSTGYYSLSQNTHDLITRFLSALPLKHKPKLITTNGEFHTIRRQLNRLEEEGIHVTRINNTPMNLVIEKIIEAIDNKTSAVLISSVFFNNGQTLTGFKDLATSCDKFDTKLLIDVYHQLNVVPFSIQKNGLDNSFVVGGGYKYCQLGEGNCFLRFPKDCTLRPVISGWLAEFEILEQTAESSNKTTYSSAENRFAGATYDPSSHYRAVEVFKFFEKQKLSPELLREISQHQIGLLINRFDKADFDQRIIQRNLNFSLQTTAGFLALHSPYASKIQTQLMNQKIHCDVRENVLRLGPAPYLSDQQLEQAMDCLQQVIKHI